MADIQLPVRIELAFDLDQVRGVVDQHAEALQQQGRIEVARYVLGWLGEDSIDADKLKHGLALEFGLTFMQEVLMDALVDKASEGWCPQCGSEDPRIRFAACEVFGDDTSLAHPWHQEIDHPHGDPTCSQCGSHRMYERKQIETPGAAGYGQACTNEHFHGPEEEW